MRIFVTAIFLLFTLKIYGAETVDYTKEVFPILKQNCMKCHNDKKLKGGFSFDSREAVLKGGKEGKEKAVIPGNSKDSIMIKLILSKDVDEYMPPKGDRLTEAEVEILKKWIDQKIPMDDKKKAVEKDEKETKK